MGKMGLGYGSEYQLLRFLGHHRQTLDSLILKNTKINEDLEYDMEWLDFPFPKDKNGSFDDEYKGIDFLPPKVIYQIKDNWVNYWPVGGNPQNWDAVIYCSPIVPNSTLKEKWIIVEAKAHLDEIGPGEGTGAKEASRKIIEKAFEATQKRFNIKTQNSWLEKYYQFANRLAFVNFMLDNEIECSFLNIYFINGWSNDPQKNVTSAEMWKEKIQDEYMYLGINDEAKKYISEIFVEC